MRLYWHNKRTQSKLITRLLACTISHHLRDPFSLSRKKAASHLMINFEIEPREICKIPFFSSRTLSAELIICIENSFLPFHAFLLASSLRSLTNLTKCFAINITPINETRKQKWALKMLFWLWKHFNLMLGQNGFVSLAIFMKIIFFGKGKNHFTFRQTKPDSPYN